MRFGVAIPLQGTFADPAVLDTLLSAAEQLGFETAWFSDHLAIPDSVAHVMTTAWLDSLGCCLYAAGTTTTLRLGTDVTVLPYRHPLILAKLVATADQLSGGRITLGVGVGYLSEEFAALATPPYESRGQVTDEYLRAIRVAWRNDGAATFEGRHVAFHNVHTGPTPIQQPLPVWVGGNAPPARRRAAEYGNGWHPLFPTPNAYATGRDEILAFRDVHGLTDPFTFSMSCATTRVTDNSSRRAVASKLQRRESLPAEFSYRPPIPTTSSGRTMLTGNPEELVSDIEAYAAVGVEHLTLRFASGSDDRVDDLIDQMQRWSQHVTGTVHEQAAATPPDAHGSP